ncbi:MAG TPA: transporter associated domain-containing protein [Acidimicrobiia bacterium]|nr:transporter associated domain-containing protein [Acidimicrobiia bacterium]
MILDRLGRIPEEPGDEVEAGRWRATILEVEDRAITLVRLTPIAPG